MRTSAQSFTPNHRVDRAVLGALKTKGAQSMDNLSTLTGIDWGQVFLSIDRLSRDGKVSLTPERPCEYRVALIRQFRR